MYWKITRAVPTCFARLGLEGIINRVCCIYLDISAEANDGAVRHGEDDVVDAVGVVGPAVASLSIALGVTAPVVLHLTGRHLGNIARITTRSNPTVKWSKCTVSVTDLLSSGSKVEVQLNGPTTDQKMVESKELDRRPLGGVTFPSKMASHRVPGIRNPSSSGYKWGEKEQSLKSFKFSSEIKKN